MQPGLTAGKAQPLRFTQLGGCFPGQAALESML